MTFSAVGGPPRPDDVGDITTFEYDPQGNLDGLDRLTDASGLYGDIRYDYDRIGNRVSRTVEHGTTATNEVYRYVADTRRLEYVEQTTNGLSGRSTAYRYNVVGSLTESTADDSTRSHYNASNRLVRITRGDDTKAAYAYNALGQRVLQPIGDKCECCP